MSEDKNANLIADDLRAYAGLSMDHAYVPAELLRVAADALEAATRPEAVVKAEAWDECVQALAWAHDHYRGGSDALAYVRTNNPYRVSPTKSGETP